MISITKTPETTIGSTGFISKWLATDSPVVFETQRKDNLISATSNNGGNCRIVLSSSNAVFYLAVGEFVSLHDQLTGVTIIAQVLSKESDTDYTLNLAYTSQSFDYYVAFQKLVSYFIEAKLTVNGVEQSSPMRFTPLPTGLDKCDISGYLQTYVNDDKAGQYIDANSKESNQSGSFLISFRENYIGNTNTDFVLNPNTWYFVKAARSIEKGTNLSEFVPNLGAPATFMNYFDEPIMWLGLPFDISFIYSDMLAGKTIQLIEKHYDSGNIELSSQTIAIDATRINSLNSIAINANTIEATCEKIKLQLVTDDATPPPAANTWYITANPFSPSLPLKFVKTGNSIAVTGNIGSKIGATPAIPNIALIPSAPVSIDILHNLNFSNLYQSPARSFYEVGISDTEFAKFTRVSRFDVTIIVEGKLASGFVDLNPATITTKVALMAALKSAFDSCVSSINTQLGTTYLQTMNSNQESMARSRVYLYADQSGGYDKTGFFAMAYSYADLFTLDVYPGLQTTYTFGADFNVQFPFHVGTLKTDGTTLFNSWNALGMRVADLLPTTTYTV